MMRVPGHRDDRVGTRSRRRTIVGAAWVVAGGVALTGCSSPTLTPASSASAAPSATVTATPAATTSNTPRPVSASSKPVRIRVPAIGVDSTLVRLGLTSKGALAVPIKAMTAGWYTGSAVPGRVGPAVIAGHVHWSGIPAVFARLGELAPGDHVIVSLSDGTTATFGVDRVGTYSKSRFPTSLVYGPLDVPGLRLITCGGYDRATRTYDANVIVFATLTTA
jgi:sortase (surface protein transpeptidase)